jgi:AcrR family transcriptional regulator
VNDVKIRVVQRPTYHHGALAEALLAEAVRQVRASGAERLSLRGVSQAVGVSASAAYNHFTDKEALLEAVVAAGFGELDRRIEEASRGGGADDAAALARLRRIGMAYIDFARTEQNLFRHAFGYYPEIRAEGDGSRASASPAYVVLNEVLDDLDERGMLRPGARANLDLVFWSTVHGFAGLALDGFIPWEAAGPLLDATERAMLTKRALRLAGAA